MKTLNKCAQLTQSLSLRHTSVTEQSIIKDNISQKHESLYSNNLPYLTSFGGTLSPYNLTSKKICNPYQGWKASFIRKISRCKASSILSPSLLFEIARSQRNNNAKFSFSFESKNEPSLYFLKLPLNSPNYSWLSLQIFAKSFLI